MDLICYLYPGWKPNLRPAPPSRAWMDDTPEAFAYRCLPLNIANAHGWEVLSPVTFEAKWNGDPSPAGVTLNLPEGTPHAIAPVSLFGQGTITFHVQGLFRTPPGWNLFLGGSPNSAKDGIAPLSGVVETDWSPYTFTMNWRFTRPDHWVRFEEGEPICFLFPVQRGVLETIEPRFVPIESEAELKADFEQWSRGRDEFHARMRDDPPGLPPTNGRRTTIAASIRTGSQGSTTTRANCAWRRSIRRSSRTATPPPRGPGRLNRRLRLRPLSPPRPIWRCASANGCSTSWRPTSTWRRSGATSRVTRG